MMRCSRRRRDSRSRPALLLNLFGFRCRKSTNKSMFRDHCKTMIGRTKPLLEQYRRLSSLRTEPSMLERQLLRLPSIDLPRMNRCVSTKRRSFEYCHMFISSYLLLLSIPFLRGMLEQQDLWLMEQHCCLLLNLHIHFPVHLYPVI